jgi:hypothetical protein
MNIKNIIQEEVKKSNSSDWSYNIKDIILEEMRHKASNQLLEEFVPTYTDFKPSDSKIFKGYKLVEKINLNYYSIVSGLFRYQPGKINYKSYSSLYEKTPKHFNEHLHNKLAVFVNQNDAINSLKDAKPIIKDWSGGNNDLALMEITISGNMETAKYSNVSVSNLDVVIGDTIESVRELQII